MRTHILIIVTLIGIIHDFLPKIKVKPASNNAC